MSDRTAIDSSTLLPLQASGPEAPSRSDAETSSLAKAAPAKKAKRPRPTFDDGTLTRTFKFPSKVYPRSSYYVTSTEIIIRIKKARKKWKLIVPKKRVVSYRTNRWFAKPRWVAIELTYTQAVKLGLAEARARLSETTPEVVASNAVAPAQSEMARPDATSTAPSPVGFETPEEGNGAGYENDLTDEIDGPDEQEGAKDFQWAADQDEFEAEEAQPLPLAFHDETAQPHATAALSTDEDEARIVDIVAQRQRPVAAPRRTFRHAVATLVAAIAGFAIWVAFDAATLNPGPECAHTEPATYCTNPIVTGSIGPSSAPQSPVSAPVENVPLSATQIAAIAQAELATQNNTASESAPAVDVTALLANTPPDTRAIFLSDRHIALPLSPPVFTPAAPPPQPAATAPAECDSLGVAGRHILINFDYGRSRLDPAILAALSDFAARLKACPASKVTIEGHTDSDGRADRNRTLSLRRAQAVHKHLLAAGVEPDQLAAIGFGQTRPTVPNVSPQNKRNNRRAALVVTTHR